MNFRYALSVNRGKSKDQDTIHFEIATYRVVHEWSSKTVSFQEHLKFQE